MRLSEAAETQIRDAANSVQWAVDNDGPKQISESLCAFANVCISIGIEIAMQHRHLQMRESFGKRPWTGPAEAIDDD